jgi:hypothetical protein
VGHIAGYLLADMALSGADMLSVILICVIFVIMLIVIMPSVIKMSVVFVIMMSLIMMSIMLAFRCITDSSSHKTFSTFIKQFCNLNLSACASLHPFYLIIPLGLCTQALQLDIFDNFYKLAECHYAECHYADCRGASLSARSKLNRFSCDHLR